MKGELPGLIRHLIFGHLCARTIRKGLVKSLGNPPLLLDKDEQAAVMQMITWKSGEILVADHVKALDPPSRGHLEWSAWTLAAYDVLRPHFDSDDDAVEYLGDVGLEAFDTRGLRTGVSMLLKRCAGDLQSVQTMFSAAMRQYGATFTWHTDDSADRIQLHIEKCFYHDFFVAHGHPHLTRVMCRLDQLWFDRIEPKRHRLSFDRTSYDTMGCGATTCTFPVDLTVSAASPS